MFIEVRFPPLSIESMWQRVKPARPTRPRGLSVTFQRSIRDHQVEVRSFRAPHRALAVARHAPAALKSLGLPHTYEAIDVGDLQHLHSMVDALRQGIFAGMNVTVPYKRAVMDMAERVDPSAEAVGAANTLVKSRSRVIAYNTDAAGLADELRTYSAAGRTRRRDRIGRGGARGGRGMHGIRRQCDRRHVAIWGGSESLVGSSTAEEFRTMGALPCGWPIPGQSDGSSSRLSEAMRLQWADIAASAAIIIQATRAGMKGADRGDDGGGHRSVGTPAS